jgi:hypothetical protein
MSYQVGSACFATVVEAGGAACAAFAPVSTLVSNGTVLRTVSCSSADLSTGALNLQITSTPVDGSATTTATISQVISYPDCKQADYVAAGEVILGALLAAWALCYGPYAVTRLLNSSRGDAS